MKLSKATAYALHGMMYMVRHRTQLPISVGMIARSEGIPVAYLSKLFQRLMKAGYIKAEKGRHKGYVFAREPEAISLLELFETIEGKPLFEECLLKHCVCSGTPENCQIYRQWRTMTQQITHLFAETSLVTATWEHPQHNFHDLPAVYSFGGSTNR